MRVAQFDAALTASAMTVANAGIEELYGDYWEDQHVAQGFLWYPASVSFGMLSDDGLVLVEVFAGEPEDQALTPTRAIEVPFTVGERGAVLISDLSSDVEVEIPPGEYGLRFETGASADPKYDWWCRFTFTPGALAEARLLVVDEGLTPSYPLLMTATPVYI